METLPIDFNRHKCRDNTSLIIMNYPKSTWVSTGRNNRLYNC